MSAATLAGRLARLRPSKPRALPVLSPRLRRRLILIALLALVLAGGYQFWLRDSSFVAVEEVTVTGLTTKDSERVRAALASAGRSMTTLHVQHERLERAVAGYPVVRELEVRADFPHGLRVHVVEHRPAAIAVGAAGSVAVAVDGTILRGMPVEGRLPTLEVEGPLGGDRLEDPGARAAAAVAGTAPAALRGRVDEIVERSDEGLVAEMRDGPELIFGNARRAAAKWAAAARVLADPEAQGASYIDLRIPGRPAAGGLPAGTVAPLAPAGTAPTTTLPPAGAAATGADPSVAVPGGVGDPAAGGTPPAPAGTTTPAPGTAAPAPQNPAVTTPPTTTAEPPTTGATGGGTAPATP